MPGYGTRLSDPEVGRIPPSPLAMIALAGDLPAESIRRGNAVVTFPERSRVELLRK